MTIYYIGLLHVLQIQLEIVVSVRCHVVSLLALLIATYFLFFLYRSRIAEDVRRKPKYWREKRYENETMTRLQWLDAANRMMYSRMRRRFLNSESFLLFPDLLQMSKPVLDDFNVDGVHMKPEGYRQVMSYILQTICTTE